MEILFASILSSIILLANGIIFRRVFFIFTKNNYAEISIYGVIFLSFISLLLNFFLPINKAIGTILIIISVILFIKILIDTKYKKKLILYLLTTSLITLLILYGSNINRPDGGLYHLPFTKIINEHKIIVGSSNINFRFGHTSIIQYLSAIYNNFFFSAEFITVPLASIFSISIYYLLEKYYSLKKNNIISTVLFLFVILFLYSFSTYSNYGNDAPAHIFYILTICSLLEIKNFRTTSDSEFYKILIFTIFLFSIKTFMIITLCIPIILFLLKKKNRSQLIFNKKIFVVSFILFCLFFKNILISGCAIYPLKQTCISNLSYYDNHKTITEAAAGEAWSKDWINQKKLGYEEYNKKFNWLNTWKNNHFKIIIKKTFPYIVFLFIFCLVIFSIKKIKAKKIFYKNQKDIIILSIIVSFLFSVIWFVNFPLYRYGYSFLYSSLILILIIILFKEINLCSIQKLKFIYTRIIILSFLLFASKNFLRIYLINKDYIHFPWPRIYSLEEAKENKGNNFEKIIRNDKILYFYSNGELCMYNSSPCSNIKVNNLENKKNINYWIYYIKN